MNIEEKIENGVLIRTITPDASDFASDELKEKRISICNGCSYLEDQICTSCGCIFQTLMTYTTSKCPQNKW